MKTLKPFEIVQFVLLGLLGVFGIFILWGPLDEWTGNWGEQQKIAYDGHIIKPVNDVRVRSPKDISWRPGDAMVGVLYGDQLFVGGSSQALVDLVSFTLNIQENSLVTLKRIDGDEPSIEVKEGGLSLTLNSSKPVSLQIGQDSVKVEGAAAEVLIKKEQTESGEKLGLALSKGYGSILQPDGQKISIQEGQALLIKNQEGQGIDVRSYFLKGTSPKDQSLFIKGQTLKFEWIIEGDDLKNLQLEIAKDSRFENTFKVQPLTNEKFFMSPLPTEPGTYSWRMTALNPQGDKVIGSPLQFEVVELKKLSIYDPFYKFLEPERWEAKIIIEEAPKATGYHFQSSKTSDFKKLIHDEKGSSTEKALVFQGGGLFYIRARSFYAGISQSPPWSESVSIRVPLPVPIPQVSHQPMNKDLNVPVYWQSLPDVDQYTVQWSNSETFKEMESKITDLNRILIPAKKNQNQWIRVNAKKSNGEYSRFSSPLMIPAYVDALAFIEASITPAYLARYNRGRKPELKGVWSGEDLGVGTILEISLDPEMKEAKRIPIQDKAFALSLEENKDVYLRITPAADPKKYFVQASSILKVPFPTIGTLSIPETRSPLDKEVFYIPGKELASVTLIWQETGDANSYDVELSKDQGFNEIILTKSVKGNAIKTEENIPSGTLYWRVRGVGEFQVSNWSKTQSFKFVYAE